MIETLPKLPEVNVHEEKQQSYSDLVIQKLRATAQRSLAIISSVEKAEYTLNNEQISPDGQKIQYNFSENRSLTVEFDGAFIKSLGVSSSWKPNY